MSSGARCLSLLLLLAGCAAPSQNTPAHESKLVQVREVAADDLAAELVKQMSLRGDGVSLLVDPRANTIAVGWRWEDLALANATVKRIGELDHASRDAWTHEGGRICGRPLEGTVVELKHANAVEVARLLTGLLDGAAASARQGFDQVALRRLDPNSDAARDLTREFRESYRPPFRIAVDTRANCLSVSTEDGNGLGNILQLIERLDVEAAPVAETGPLPVLSVKIAGQAVEVIPLEHARAEEIADTLRELDEACHRVPLPGIRCYLPLQGLENDMLRLYWDSSPR